MALAPHAEENGMSFEMIRHEVQGLLSTTNADIQDAEKVLVTDSGLARVRAAGELVHLRSHRETLQSRLRELERPSAGPGSTLFQYVRENWMIVMLSLEHWIEKH